MFSGQLTRTLNAPTLSAIVLLFVTEWCGICASAEPAAPDFDRDVQPTFAEYCFGCHADGASEGSFSFEELARLDRDDSQHELNSRWYRVLRKLQSGQMPPPGEARPEAGQVDRVASWIKFSAFGIDPQNPNPGHVTIRRLNQVEYRNSVRDLIGVEYDTAANFPADDTGHGFDNIGDVLSISPLLLEKYVNAAEEIVTSVVPVVSGVVAKRSVLGSAFELTAGQSLSRSDQDSQELVLSYYQPATARAALDVAVAGDYTVRLNMVTRETYVDDVFDDNKCRLRFGLDEVVFLDREFVRQGRRSYTLDFPHRLNAGNHHLVFSVEPLSKERQVRQLRFHVSSVDIIGPHSEEHFAKPPGYRRFFPRDVPADAEARRRYTRELLGKFAFRAFRRPVTDRNLERLVMLAENVYTNGETFEAGVAKAMTAILASPMFLFREEARAVAGDDRYPLIDEYSLASRLSYFLWSTMPDEELFALAKAGKLRENLDAQITRMLEHEKAQEFYRNFTGQWLRARAVETIQINEAAVLNREPAVIDPEADVRRRRFFALFRKGARRSEAEQGEYERERENFLRSFRGGAGSAFSDDVRAAMRSETELVFEHIFAGDRNLLELVDSDYTFLNETLWGHYQIQGVEPIVGDEMRLVKLPTGSQRGGILTQGTTLVVTSNPDRTSPVKRGLFILENVLGSPPAAPPPNIPALEDVEAEPGKRLTLRETLAIHRASAICSSCHNRMDPLGLALENFNALGKFRQEELGQPVESAGALDTGEAFSSISELKKILVETRSSEIYRCIAEKMMTYALGRAVEYHDVHTIDQIVADLDENGGRAQSLVRNIIRSNAFQRTQNIQPVAHTNTNQRGTR